MRKFLLLLFTFLTTGIAQAQDNKSDLVINEVMQSNVDGIMDDINEFPDSWVELYNTTDNPINLKDYKLWDKNKVAKAWQLPDMTVAAKNWVIVYCDKEDEAGGLHATFRMDSGKTDLFLFKNDEPVDSIKDLKKQPAPNIAYGRKTDGSDEWGYQLTPSPGTSNTGEVCDYDHVLGNVEFSELGFVTSGKKTVNLTLSLPDGAPEGAYIAYTNDGKEPTANSTKYTKPIAISKSTVIRAKAFCDGWLSPMSTVQSYIFHPRSMTIPVVSIVTDKRYLDDSKIGIFANNKQAKVKNNWRRPVNFEYFAAENSNSSLNQLCETRIQGGQSRENALKSMAFYANKRFGTKRFAYEFFPDQKPGLSDYKSISLRNGGNDFGDLYFRDAIIQRTMGQHVDLDWQACRSVVIYINGEYRGMINLRERANEDNIFANYGGLEDLDEIEISQLNSQVYEELKEGTRENYDAFKAFYSEKGHTKAEYDEWLDCGEFLNLYIMNLFYGNLDFPGNNLVLWRPNDKDTTSGLPKVWRVIAKDTDFGLGLYGRSNEYNTIEWIYNPSYDSGNAWANTEPATRLFRHMLEDEDLLQMFIDRCSIYMGDFLNAKGTGEIMDLIKNEVMDEFTAHRQKYNQWGDVDGKFNDAKKWLEGWTETGWGGWGGWWGGGQQETVHPARTENFYKYVGSHYKLGDAIPLTVNADGDVSNVVFNDIPLSKDFFNGMFYPNRQITIKADAPSGMEIYGWRVTTTNASGSTSRKTIEGNELSMTMPACKKMTIEAILDTESGIDAVTTNSRTWTWKRTAEGIQVSGVPEGISVSLHDLRGITRETETSSGNDIILPAERGKMFLLKVGGETVKIQ